MSIAASIAYTQEYIQPQSVVVCPLDETVGCKRNEPSASEGVLVRLSDHFGLYHVSSALVAAETSHSDVRKCPHKDHYVNSGRETVRQSPISRVLP